MANVQTTKAYRNENFLCSEGARNIRILCECTETQQRFFENGVTATLLFFGSARAKSSSAHEAAMAENDRLLREAEAAGNVDDIANLQARKAQLDKMKWMCKYYDKVSELAKELTAWSTKDGVHLALERKVQGVTRYHGANRSLCSPTDVKRVAFNEEDYQATLGGEGSRDPCIVRQAIVVCSGGGPGFMEAASRGAASVSGSRNIGMGISLPFEKGLNPFVSPDLAFEYHYFFTRKLWMVFYCQALVVAPGGLGTLDELFEILTLRQTGKVQKDLPIVLLGKEYWESVVNWKFLVNSGVMNAADINDLFITDEVSHAFNFLTAKLSDEKLVIDDIGDSLSMMSFLESDDQSSRK